MVQSSSNFDLGAAAIVFEADWGYFESYGFGGIVFPSSGLRFVLGIAF